MTPDTLEALTAQAKKYARIDYEDDDDLVAIMVEAVAESMTDVIPTFNADSMTGRQKIILYKSVKHLYDDRDQFGTEKQEVKVAAASMLLSEIYEPKGELPSE